jgi:hypothetical protein
MSAIVIDTNVLLVANGLTPHMGDECRLECLSRLEKARSSESVVVDRQNLILDEYHHKLDPNRRPPGPGDAFLRHLLQNMGNTRHVATIDLTAINQEKTDFSEFPDDQTLRNTFDPADRMFVAASNAHSNKPPIVQSADSKWFDWELLLNGHGIHLEILCREKLKTIYVRKKKRKQK